MKGENNSLKKKVQSLQIDYEKLSRKVSTTQARSSGGTNSADEPPFGSQFDSKQQVGSEKRRTATITGPGTEVDWHNQSI